MTTIFFLFFIPRDCDVAGWPSRKRRCPYRHATAATTPLCTGWWKIVICRPTPPSSASCRYRTPNTKRPKSCPTNQVHIGKDKMNQKMAALCYVYHQCLRLCEMHLLRLVGKMCQCLHALLWLATSHSPSNLIAMPNQVRVRRRVRWLLRPITTSMRIDSTTPGISIVLVVVQAFLPFQHRTARWIPSHPTETKTSKMMRPLICGRVDEEFELTIPLPVFIHTHHTNHINLLLLRIPFTRAISCWVQLHFYSINQLVVVGWTRQGPPERAFYIQSTLVCGYT